MDSSSARPILDTHIHLYQVTRPGGVPWPGPEAKPLYRDMLPAAYEAVARPLGIVGTGIIEASNLHDDTRFILDLTRASSDYFPFLVANLEIGAPDFPDKLAEIAADPRVVGIRGFLWSPTLTLDHTQLAHLELLAARGMTLDLISRGGLNPKAKVDELLAAVPNLRVIVDHLAGAKGATPAPEWVSDLTRLSRRANLSIKVSSLFDMFNFRGDENDAWDAPADLASYRPHLDVLMNTFGPDRLVFGSNWPVCELGGGIAREVALVEEWLAPHGQKARDAVMHDSARRFYRRDT